MNRPPIPSRTTLLSLGLTGLAALAIVLTSSGTRAADAPPSLKAILEVDREAYYAGDPVSIRISIWNDGSAPLSAPPGDVPTGFELFDSEGRKVPGAQAPAASAGDAKAAPDASARMLAPGSFFGFARDLTTIFPKLREAGTYRLQWRSGALESNALILRVLPRYDPDKDYSARIETDLGPFTIEFLKKDAPIAVKTFVDLAQSGFYDGVVFHYVEPDRVVVSGDPTGTGQGGPGFGIPHERTQVKMLAGTVLMMGSGRPPTNGSIFAVLLAPRPDFEGNATGFAQVVDGLDVLKKISQMPASPKDAPQPHKPVQAIRINKVVVRTKTT